MKNDGGARPGTTVTHEANVPTDRSGYHLILAVWKLQTLEMRFIKL
ncbi:lytic polysaccharide monooxygenase [Bacillus cereus]